MSETARSSAKTRVVQANVKIWPDKNIDNGAMVNHSLIWGAQGRKCLFSRYGVTGVGAT